MSNGKCSHDKCLCTVDGDDFCSDYCQEVAEALEVDALDHDCACGHPACSGG